MAHHAACLALQASLNEFAWSTVSNVIYLDSPAGVGLSYSETRSDYVTNDTHTATDADAFLRHFFQRYPEFLRNDLYIAGAALATLLHFELPERPACSNECHVYLLCKSLVVRRGGTPRWHEAVQRQRHSAVECRTLEILVASLARKSFSPTVSCSWPQARATVACTCRCWRRQCWTTMTPAQCRESTSRRGGHVPMEPASFMCTALSST